MRYSQRSSDSPCIACSSRILNISTWSKAGRPPFVPSARGTACSSSARNIVKSTSTAIRSRSSPFADSSRSRSSTSKNPGCRTISITTPLRLSESVAGHHDEGVSGGVQLCRLRTARRPLRMPLRRHSPVGQIPTPCRRVPAQFPRDRRRRTFEAAGDLSHPKALRPPQRNPLSLRKGQISRRERLRRTRQMGRRHPARLSEPASSDRQRYPNLHRRVLAREPLRHQHPEPTPVLPPCHTRTPRRPQLTPQHPI